MKKKHSHLSNITSLINSRRSRRRAGSAISCCCTNVTDLRQCETYFDSQRRCFFVLLLWCCMRRRADAKCERLQKGVFAPFLGLIAKQYHRHHHHRHHRHHHHHLLVCCSCASSSSVLLRTATAAIITISTILSILLPCFLMPPQTTPGVWTQTDLVYFKRIQLCWPGLTRIFRSHLQPLPRNKN